MRILIDLDPTAPAEGLALDEALFRSVRSGREGVVRIWVNDRAAVIGRSQSMNAEVDLAEAAASGIPALRRISGGGAVYHYPGNLNVTVVGLLRGAVDAVFRRCGDSIADGVATLGIRVSPEGSALFWRDRKVAGAAQARRGTTVLYHSTLLVQGSDLPMDRILRAMRPGYRSDAVGSRASPTISLEEACRRRIGIDQTAEAVLWRITDVLRGESVPRRVQGPLPEESAIASELAATKYRDPAWNQSA